MNICSSVIQFIAMTFSFSLLNILQHENLFDRHILQGKWLSNFYHLLYLKLLQVYETLSGVKVEGKLPVLNKESVLQSLPPEWPADPINEIRTLTDNSLKTLIVLDDDPTGTQTVHDVEVLTEWYDASINFKRQFSYIFPKKYFWIYKQTPS